MKKRVNGRKDEVMSEAHLNSLFLAMIKEYKNELVIEDYYF